MQYFHNIETSIFLGSIWRQILNNLDKLEVFMKIFVEVLCMNGLPLIGLIKDEYKENVKESSPQYDKFKYT